MALIEKITDFTSTDTALDKLFKDYAVDAGTLFKADFLDPQCYAEGAVPAGAMTSGRVIYDLSDAGNNGSLADNFSALGAAGMTFDANDLQVTLPNSCKLASGATHFGFGGWIKPAAQASGGVAECVAGYGTTTNTSSQWFIQRHTNGTTYFGYCAGVTAPSLSVSVGEVAHVFWDNIISGGNVITNAYKNGALVMTSGSTALPGGVLPTPAATPAIGRGNGMAQGFRGHVGDFVMQDFSAVGARSVAEFLSREVTFNVGRFA